MAMDWAAENRWRTDADAAYEEAERRIEQCAASRCERLELDLGIEQLPPTISSLTWLRKLNIYGAPIRAYGVLEPLKLVTSLQLGSLDADFPGLEFLGDWQDLKDLEVIARTTLDLHPLQRCTGLQRLGLSCSQHNVELRNLDALRRCDALEFVSLENMQSDDWDSVARWKALRFAQIIGSNLSSLSPFHELQELDYLNVASAPLDDLTPLSRLSKLKKLNVARTNVRDLGPIAGVAALEELDSSHTQVADLKPLALLAQLQRSNEQQSSSDYGNAHLKSISVAGCPVESVSPLAELTRLERVDLSDTRVTSLEPLHRRPNLRSLGISGAPITDLGPKGSLGDLASLSARGCPIQSVAALHPGTRLQAIDLSGTRVADMEPLRRAKDCRSLSLRGSLVRNLMPLLETGSQEQDHRYSQQQLDFRDTPAAAASPELTRLAALAEDDLYKCFQETKRYLRKQASSSLLARLFVKSQT